MRDSFVLIVFRKARGSGSVPNIWVKYKRVAKYQFQINQTSHRWHFLFLEMVLCRQALLDAHGESNIESHCSLISDKTDPVISYSRVLGRFSYRSEGI